MTSLMRQEKSWSPMHRKERGRELLFLCVLSLAWNDVALDTLSAEQQCNRTFYGEVGLKYPLRFSEPEERFHPFLCDITFAPVGGRTGDIIELTFLSFQVGYYYEITKHDSGNSNNCQNGHLTIREPRIRAFNSGNGSTDGAFCGQMTAKKATFFSTDNTLSLTVHLPPRRVFFGHSLPFNLFFTYRILSASDSLEPESQSKPNLLNELGVKSPGSYCDRVFDDCLPPKMCKIRSPNYPGFYQRNINCHFHIRQMTGVPAGHKARILLSQADESRISVYSSSYGLIRATATSSSPPKTTSVLRTDCPSDYVRVHDGRIPTESSVIAKFCGSGSLPPVTSSGPEMLVILHSAPQSVMYDSHVELDVQVEVVKIEEHETATSTTGTCDYVYDGSSVRSGIISSPSYSLPSNTSCSYIFRSSRPGDRIWFSFASYEVQDLNEWGNEERCDLTQLQLHGVRDPESMKERTSCIACNHSLALKETHLATQSTPSPPSSTSMSKVLRFCEKSSPRICSHATASSHRQLWPPCAFPDQSYLSETSKLTIKQYFYKPTAFYAGSGSFTGRFEFIDTTEFGDPVEGSLCDRWIFSHKESSGKIRSSHNTLYFGRGGQTTMSCTFHFVGMKNERLRLRLTSVRLDSTHCVHRFDPRNGMFSCHKTTPDPASPERTGILSIMDSINSQRISAGCFCSDGQNMILTRDRSDGLTHEWNRAFTLDLIGPEVTVNLTVVGMKWTDDYNNFGFEANFEFYEPPDTCSSNAVFQKKEGKEGEVLLSLPPDHGIHAPLKCRWLIHGSLGKHLYLKFHGFIPKLDEDCTRLNHYVIYSGNPWIPTATVCVSTRTSSSDPRPGNHLSSGERDQDVDLFSSSWYNRSVNADHTLTPSDDATTRDSPVVRLLIEFLVPQPAPSTVLGLKWLEVTKPFESTGESLMNIDCKFKCPELNACISPDLWCDGTPHCPSGYDEVSQHCPSSNFLWFFVVVASSLVLISAAIGSGIGLKMLWHRRRSQKEDTRQGVESEIPFHLDQGSFRSTYLRPGAISVALSSSIEGSSEQDFVPSEREFDFRGFRDVQTMGHNRRHREPINGPSYASSTLTRDTVPLSSPFTTYNPYERTAFLHYYQGNVF